LTLIVRSWCHYVAGGVRYGCMYTQFVVCGGGEKVQRVTWWDGGKAVECGVKADQYRRKPVTRSQIRGTHENRNREKERTGANGSRDVTSCADTGTRIHESLDNLELVSFFCAFVSITLRKFTRRFTVTIDQTYESLSPYLILPFWTKSILTISRRDFIGNLLLHVKYYVK